MLHIEKLSGPLGAEVFGVDLAPPLGETEFAAIHQAFIDHIALFFPGQSLTPPQLSGFVQRFGTPLPHPYMKALEGAPAVHELCPE